LEPVARCVDRLRVRTAAHAGVGRALEHAQAKRRHFDAVARVDHSAVCVVGLPSKGDLELQHLALVHQPISIRHLLERPGAVEDAPRVDPPVEHVREQLLDIGAR